MIKTKNVNLADTDIVIGTLGESETIDALAQNGDISVDEIKGKWEAFTIQEVDDTVVIAGSDKRGTIYGIYDLSEKIGVSPWTFWSDIKPETAEELYINLPKEGYTEGEPSVKYRGIFLNDEYNFNRWTSTGFPQNVNIEKYEKVFELMLRLKLNYLWPAMHNYSTAFHKVEGAAELANDYGVVMGSSHCEPLLRNNLGELDTFQPEWENDPANAEKTLYKPIKNESGNWVAWMWTDHDDAGNAVNNKEFLEDYWRACVREIGEYDNVYTLGMRGVHDGSFSTNMSDYGQALMEIINAQRKILKEEIADKQGIDLTDIPQVYIPYKDVLSYYNAGAMGNGALKVPEDVNNNTQYSFTPSDYIGSWCHVTANMDFIKKTFDITLTNNSDSTKTQTFKSIPFSDRTVDELCSMYLRAAKRTGTVRVDSIEIFSCTEPLYAVSISTCDENNAPINNAVVTLQRTSTQETVEPETEGEFEGKYLIADDKYTVSVTADGYISAEDIAVDIENALEMRKVVIPMRAAENSAILP